MNMEKFFRGCNICDMYVFCVMCNVDIECNEDEVEDLFEMMVDEVRERWFVFFVRFEV